MPIRDNAVQLLFSATAGLLIRRGRPNENIRKKKNNKMSSNMRPVPHTKQEYVLWNAVSVPLLQFVLLSRY